MISTDAFVLPDMLRHQFPSMNANASVANVSTDPPARTVPAVAKPDASQIDAHQARSAGPRREKHREYECSAPIHSQ